MEERREGGKTDYHNMMPSLLSFYQKGGREREKEGGNGKEALEKSEFWGPQERSTGYLGILENEGGRGRDLRAAEGRSKKTSMDPCMFLFYGL